MGKGLRLRIRTYQGHQVRKGYRSKARLEESRDKSFRGV